MSNKTRISHNAALKLRSGQTYWRCQTLRDGTVHISEEFLKGSKYTTVMRSMFPENIPERDRKVLYVAVKIGPKNPKLWMRGSYLSSVNPGSSINTFRTRRAAERWKREVEAGLHPEHVAQAHEHWDMCDYMSYDLNDYDDGPYYGLEEDHNATLQDEADYYAQDERAYPAGLEGGQTLGQLLRAKLDAAAEDETFALEA